jgi:molecular chaperone GrpE
LLAFLPTSLLPDRVKIANLAANTPLANHLTGVHLQNFLIIKLHTLKNIINKLNPKNMEEVKITTAEEQADTLTNEATAQDVQSTTIEAPETVSEESNEIAKLQAELNEQKDKYIRKVAEFDNYMRRTAKERIEQSQTAGKEVIVALLDVLDDCDRAEKQLQSTEDVEQIKQGVQLVFNKLRNTLLAKGLKPMESINTAFDVEKHEAITEIPAPTEELKEKVVDEINKGYYLNEKLIRFAKVVVGK